MGPEDQNWVIRVGSKCLYLQLNHEEPHNLFSYTTRSQILEDRLFVPIPYVPQALLSLYQACPWLPSMFLLQYRQSKHPAMLLQVFTQQHRCEENPVENLGTF